MKKYLFLVIVIIVVILAMPMVFANNYGGYYATAVDSTTGPQYTGQGGTKSFNITICNGEVGIISGVRIDNMTGGVFIALPPGNYTCTITDGQAIVQPKERAYQTWNELLNIARCNNQQISIVDSGPLK